MRDEFSTIFRITFPLPLCSRTLILSLAVDKLTLQQINHTLQLEDDRLLRVLRHQVSPLSLNLSVVFPSVRGNCFARVHLLILGYYSKCLNFVAIDSVLQKLSNCRHVRTLEAQNLGM